MRLCHFLILLITAGTLAGCAIKPLPPAEVIAPDPFGYRKRSAVCTLAPTVVIPGGHSVAISTRSDDGLCGVTISRPEGGAYASFVLATLPTHGNAFIYNYNRQTVVTYTATTAYAGPDSFTVSLVPGSGQPRSRLQVDVTADATGVPRPPPPPPVAPSPRPTRKKLHHRKPAASS